MLSTRRAGSEAVILDFQREFLALAANMLRCRFHVIHGRTCTKVKWVHYQDTPIDQDFVLCRIR